MKRYEIHGKDFCKMNDFMKELTDAGVDFKPYRINGYFLDVEDKDTEKYEKMAKAKDFQIKQVEIVEV